MNIKIPFLATFMTFLGLVILCLLGNWQVQRLQWKQGILDAINVEMSIDASQRLITNDDLNSIVEFKRGYIEGVYNHDKEIFLQSRTLDGVPGYHVIVPLRIDDENVIIVNRGWIPNELDRKENFVISRPLGKVRVVGMLSALPSYNSFVPDNNPSDDMWYKIDVSAIALHFSIDGFVDKILYVEVADLGGGYPIPAAEILTPNNNHAQYVMFWFTMALALLVIYILRFIVPQFKAEN